MRFTLLWKARPILSHLIRRDVLITYKQTILGVFWTVLKPIMMAAIIVFVFEGIGNFPDFGFPYVLIALSALSVWEFFSSAISRGSVCLIDDRDLITRVNFPRMILLINASLKNSIGLFINLVVTFAFMLYYNIPFTVNLLWIPVIYFFTIILNLSLGLWLGTINVFFRDVNTIVPFLLRLGLFISPVGFTFNSVPEVWQKLYCINPMVGIIRAMRFSILGETFRPDLSCILIGCLSLLLVLLSGLYIFGRYERKFADLI
ncbi:lipopolysaccharide transport system permease protein [Roseivirga ehrenbergii]|nr:lipopolysaccharide transport system permease protein [Roseivirga ehrenbergii]